MIKKCLIFSLLALTLPVMYVKAECSEAQIEAYRKELENVTFDLEYVPKGTTIETYMGPYNIEETNLIKLTAPNMPNGYTAYFFDSNHRSFIVSNEIYSLLTGGVYSISIQNDICLLKPIKEYTIMIPHYDIKNEKNNIWFDGTYNSTDKIYSKNSSKIKIDSRLLAALSSLFLVIIIIVIFTVRKHRRNKI